MQAATLTDEPLLKAEQGTVSAGQPDQWSSLLQVWEQNIRAKSRTLWEPTRSTQAEVHRPGQTEGGTAAEKLVKPGADIRPDYKDGGVARGLGKLLVVLIKVQDWPMTTANNSIQDIPKFNREMEEKAHLDSKQQSGSLPRLTRWMKHTTVSFPGHQSRLDRGYSRQ